MGASSFSRTAIFATSVFAFQFWAAAQGTLTPPGAPAATMKSLDQVEARTAITNTASLVTISQPGSYYLTHNLNVTAGDAIDITTNQVTLDLNGFTISSTSGNPSGTAVYLAKASGNIEITIRNGAIKSGTTNNNNGVFSGPGFMNGISHNPAGAPSNVHVSRISVYGVSSNGILTEANYASVVDYCTVNGAGFAGIGADTVSHCIAYNCGFVGIGGGTVSDSRAEQFTGDGWGIQAAVANNSEGIAHGIGAYGIYARSGNGCTGTTYGNTGAGLFLSTANNCTGYNYGTASTALSAIVANNCFANDNSSSPGSTALNSQSAVNCYASSTAGVAIKANIANSCIINGGTTNITHKYNMP